ncbi:MAG: nuclear transport factor 2 family protein [Micromonosporaceae bacterium]|nr:nuclear transport factor 2 family protein [Micromonosporaceae bacterium]
MTVTWQASEAAHPARDAARRSMDAVSRGAKDEWLALFADDAIVEDPIGPGPFDESGKGHRGRTAISAFWDASIAMVERFEFVVRDSFACGDEVANVGTITSHLPGGMVIDADGVFTYRVDEAGRITALRAYWEIKRAATTLHKTT